MLPVKLNTSDKMKYLWRNEMPLMKWNASYKKNASDELICHRQKEMPLMKWNVSDKNEMLFKVKCL
jgi:hypothetical protein